jgi:hypothetical protein
MRCSTWWTLHESLALTGNLGSKFKVMGAIGALCVWVGRDYTNEEVQKFLATENHYEDVAKVLPGMLNLARNTPTPENSLKLGDMIWRYVEAHPQGNARLMFGALISMLRPVIDRVRQDSNEMTRIATQELIECTDEETFKRVWGALVDKEGDMVSQMHVILALAKAAIEKSGPAQYPGNPNVDACGFIGYQIANAVKCDDEGMAGHIAAGFLMSVPYDHSYQLPWFLAKHAR